MNKPVSTFLRFLFHVLKSVFNFIFSIYTAKEYWFTNKTDGSKENIPKVIWMYWESEHPNHLVDYCIENTKNVCCDYDVFILNSSNIHKYIDMPSLDDKKLKKAIQADYIRLALLKKYGGIWMDASIFITQDFSWFLDKLDQNSNFLFYSDHCTTNSELPIFENWFIAAPKNSLLIADWFSEFEKCILSSEPTKYYEAVTGEDFIQKIPNTDYLMCY
ncbi:glycosyltransferase family 32 protein, partial [Acinetobacter rathckeae]|uniref:glycosyltransferase family 32 protein n=1 Tax=Acinetobacter rathckeae TaxID=2605272 RepID=UPI002B1BD4B3